MYEVKGKTDSDLYILHERGQLPYISAYRIEKDSVGHVLTVVERANATCLKDVKIKGNKVIVTVNEPEPYSGKWCTEEERTFELNF
jgi:hypothetical protein